MSEVTPEIFLKAFLEKEGENPQTAEEETFVDKMPKAMAIKDDLLRALAGKWEHDERKDRTYSGLFEIGGKKVHLSAQQKIDKEMGGIAHLSIHYDQYEPGKRTAIRLDFIRHQISDSDWRHALEAQRQIIVEGKEEVDRTHSLIWTDYRNDKVIRGHNDDNAEEGLKFAAEVRDALAGKPIGPAKPRLGRAKFTRRKLLGLER